MRRVAVILSTCALVVLAIAWAAVRRAGPAAEATGRELYFHRNVLHALRIATPGTPVVWLGDSTLMGFPGLPSYPRLVERDALEPRGVGSLLVAATGFDFFADWAVAGRVAALRPEVVVLIANLRVTGVAAGGTRAFSDLVGAIAPADLPEALTLPYAVRGLTAPRLLLAQLLATPTGERAFLTWEGLRRNVHEAAFWELLGPADRPPTPLESSRTFFRVADTVLAAFDMPIGPRHPTVQFARAAVSKLARGGATVLVVVTPIPWELMGAKYDAERIAGRIAMLREVLGGAGAEVLDLHRALPKDEFRDFAGHFTAQGAIHMAELVTPPILEALAARGVIAPPAAAP